MEPYSYSPSALVKSYKVLKHQGEGEAPSTSESKPYTQKDVIAVSAIQMTASGMTTNDVSDFWKVAQDAVKEAAEGGANLILLPELFIGPYFCQSQVEELMEFAETISPDHFILKKMASLAKQYQVVLPISLYERKNNALYNSLVMIDADGSILGTYRKSHIPDGTGYQEKFYFSPGDTGFKVWSTRVGKVGVAICWDQWFPEAARAMALLGADVLLYPTAIGSEPQDPTLDSSDHWQRVMQGHSAANMIPVVAANRFGTEILLNEDGKEKQRIRFYGRSFITNETGAIVEEAPDDQIKPYIVLSSVINPAKNRQIRSAWGLFRDRRPELYKILLTKDGSTTSP